MLVLTKVWRKANSPYQEKRILIRKNTEPEKPPTIDIASTSVNTVLSIYLI
jgi:hypothetical protein